MSLGYEPSVEAVSPNCILMALDSGFEPVFAVSEAAVLPLDDSRILAGIQGFEP